MLRIASINWGSVALVRRRIALGQLFQSGAVSGEGIAVWARILGGVVATGLGAGAVGLVGKSQTQPQVGFPAHEIRQDGVQSTDRQHRFVSQFFLGFGRHGEQIGAIDLFRARALLGLENRDVTVADVHDHDRAGIGQSGEIEEVVVLAVVIGFRKNGAGKQNEVARSCSLFGKFLTTAREFLRPAQIVDRDRIGVLRQHWRREQQHHQTSNNPCETNRESFHVFLLRAASLTRRRRN